MLNQNTSVIFSYGYGIYSQSFRCRSVVFGLGIIGDVEEDLDFELVEDYEGVRQKITVRLEMTFTEALWMANFIASTSKKLTIDGTDVEVVNGFNDIDFELFNGYNSHADIELVFYKKTIGQVSFSETQVLIYLQDDIKGVF